MKRYALNVRCKSEHCSAEPFEIVNGAFVLLSDAELLIEALREIDALSWPGTYGPGMRPIGVPSLGDARGIAAAALEKVGVK